MSQLRERKSTEAGTVVVWRKYLPYCRSCGERVIPAPADHPWKFLHSVCPAKVGS